ncbi:protein phosphatase 2C domain-containing protein [Paenibacillus barcinonensis]|uniref:Protein phosphatase 2C domain-containing protein n=1 Tax=Paenibacillus barcinonensis TaxID=198119 RepID=A0A2V4VWH6_PAEBA|nr:protein phosphatase 2C domain-containing protein [Paenibacillus barcinonensis]PYE52085.1 serine/threonine protein phosphatase PrpC [Paenibacillus barcinonensis]QKS59767.1 protein phosphatase 2C domain-containing protein [Paenibacillus barcinonensis]
MRAMRMATMSASDRAGHAKQRHEHFCYVSEQTGEQPLARYQGRLKCRYGYGRAAETVHQGDAGQDYVAIRMHGNICNFVLCDGVGMSYLGDFAARFLGNALLEWLEMTSSPTAEGIESYLHEITDAASRQLEQLQPLDSSPLLLREVLMEKRSQGSQAMYICGRIELNSNARKSKVWLAWQGDSRIRLWCNGQEQSEQFQKHCSTNERWSTRGGPIGGKPHIFETKAPAHDVCRLQLYTDGLNDLDAINTYIPDEHIQVLLDAVHTGGLEDDAAFIEMEW